LFLVDAVGHVELCEHHATLGIATNRNLERRVNRHRQAPDSPTKGWPVFGAAENEECESAPARLQNGS
jgi:hypothetical protein